MNLPPYPRTKPIPSSPLASRLNKWEAGEWDTLVVRDYTVDITAVKCGTFKERADTYKLDDINFRRACDLLSRHMSGKARRALLSFGACDASDDKIMS